MMTAPTGNLFQTAAVVETKKAAARKATKPVNKTVGLSDYAAVDALFKALKSRLETLKPGIEEQMSEHFLTEGLSIRRRPENYKGREGTDTASLELRIRSSASGLSDLEENLLAKHDIAVVDNVIVQEAFIVNPEYNTNFELLQKASDALVAAGLPADIIQRQAGVTKRVVTEESLNQVFQKPRAVAEQLLPVVGCLAVKPKAGTTDVEVLLERVSRLLVAQEEAGE
jgi:hypothetical protein